MPSTAIIGAGFGGLCAAHTVLAHSDHDVTLFDKGYFPGGRLATRRWREHDACIDHGAQYFTAKTSSFRRLVDTWQDLGLVEPWNLDLRAIEEPRQPPQRLSRDARDIPRWVATPHMNALAEHLAATLDVRTRHRVTAIARDPSSSSYTLTCDTPDGSRIVTGFDHLILNLPPAQALPLLTDLAASSSSPLLNTLRKAPDMEPCWAWMGVFARGELALPMEAAFVNVASSPLSWIAVDSSKPARADQLDTLLLHATSSWSKTHVEAPPEQVERALFLALQELIEHAIPRPISSQVHRWRYARPAEDATSDALAARYDDDLQIALCGDWLDGGRVEGAFQAGVTAAHHIMGHHTGSDTSAPAEQPSPW